MKNRPFTRGQHVVLFALFISLLLFNGCSHYQLGPTAELPFKSIYVAPVINASDAPQTQAILSQQIVEQLMRDARIKIADKENAEAQLTVTLRSYEKDVSATQQNDTGLARSFNLRLIATVTLEDSASGKTYIDEKSFDAEQHAYIDGGFQPAEYQAVPVLADRLASKIANAVTSVW